MPADLGWRLGAGFKRLCLQTIKNHINLNCQRRNGFQKLLTASTAPPQPCAGKAQRQTQSHQPTDCGIGWEANPAASAASLCWCDCKPKPSMASDTFFECKCNGEKRGQPLSGRCPHDSASPSGRIAATGASGNRGLWTFVWPPFFPPKDLDLKIRKRDKAQMTVGS